MLLFVGHLLAPAYDFRPLMTTEGYASHLAGILLSPGRGLLVYVPVVLVPLVLMARYCRKLPQRSLAVLALAVIFAIILTTALSSIWWGGWSYGPRLVAEAVPWFALIAILGVRAWLDDLQLTMTQRAIQIGAAALLLIVSTIMNAPGALFHASTDWNGKPNLIDAHSERLWDWRHPQFLAWYAPWEERRRAYLVQRRDYFEQRREAAISMEQQMLARGDIKAAQRLGSVIGQLNRELGYR